MKYTVKQAATISGVSVRTLHYYDEIGLLAPTEITAAGYRTYNDDAMRKLQQILFFKELDFELKDIASIMTAGNYNEVQILSRQKALLELKKSRLENLIQAIDTRLKGGIEMDFKAFDMTEIEEAKIKYKEEVESRWGATAAYKESKKKTDSYSKDQWEMINKEAEELYKDFAENMNLDPEDPKALKIAEAWQNHISKYYYTCSNEMLSGLGAMYIADERFLTNIDQRKQGLAAFMSKVIAAYCKKGL
jgi:DNA-binding transcriptional MerR regulator